MRNSGTRYLSLVDFMKSGGFHLKSSGFHVKSTQNLINSDVSAKTLQFGWISPEIRRISCEFHEIRRISCEIERPLARNCNPMFLCFFLTQQADLYIVNEDLEHLTCVLLLWLGIVTCVQIILKTFLFVINV